MMRYFYRDDLHTATWYERDGQLVLFLENDRRRAVKALNYARAYGVVE